MIPANPKAVALESPVDHLSPLVQFYQKDYRFQKSNPPNFLHFWNQTPPPQPWILPWLVLLCFLPPEPSMLRLGSETGEAVPQNLKMKEFVPEKGISKTKSLLSIESWLLNGGIPMMGFLINPITKGGVSSPTYPKQPGPFFSLLTWFIKILDCRAVMLVSEDVRIVLDENLLLRGIIAIRFRKIYRRI